MKNSVHHGGQKRIRKKRSVGEAELKIPHALLREAGIPLDAELVVRTVEGAVLMGAEEPLAVVRKLFYGMLRLVDMTEKEAMEILEKGGFLDG